MRLHRRRNFHSFVPPNQWVRKHGKRAYYPEKCSIALEDSSFERQTNQGKRNGISRVSDQQRESSRHPRELNSWQHNRREHTDNIIKVTDPGTRRLEDMLKHVNISSETSM